MISKDNKYFLEFICLFQEKLAVKGLHAQANVSQQS